MYSSCSANPLTMPTGDVRSGTRLMADLSNDQRRSVYRPDPGWWIVGSRLLVLAWFENNLGWAPSLDGSASLARTALAGKKLQRFELTAFQATKVRNVSSVGSHQKSTFRFCTLRATPV
jgi:hypothetical protein